MFERIHCVGGLDQFLEFWMPSVPHTDAMRHYHAIVQALCMMTRERAIFLDFCASVCSAMPLFAGLSSGMTRYLNVDKAYTCLTGSGRVS